ncbi:MAG TPA: hypothetical protein VEK08_23840 [Planctomycetota bacterium]|nr:hypothetical protein [Planctomycetota bacterium]
MSYKLFCSLALAGGVSLSAGAAGTEAGTGANPQPVVAQNEAEKAEQELSIGMNPRVSPEFQQRIAFFNRAREIAAQFGAQPSKETASATKADEEKLAKERMQALKSLLAENRNRAIEGLLTCLDSKSVEDPQTRKGAIAALEACDYKHATVSAYRAASAVGDPEQSVRNAALTSIKASKDDAAIGGMIHYLMASFDDNGKVLNAQIRDQAAAALRDLGDKRVYQALAYYVTMEIRATNTELNNFATRQIDSFSVNNGANVNVIVPASFPIQFPELKITRVRTTVKCPAASSLEAITGQNFGEDVERWEKWISKQK